MTKVETSRLIVEPPWEILICPYCGADLVRSAGGARCRPCAAEYCADADGALDLRLQRAKTVAVEHELGTDLFSRQHPDFSPLDANPEIPVDYGGVEVPVHLTQAMLRHLPAARGAGARLLDLGCGKGGYRPVAERAGYQWTGVDFHEPGAPIHADAHALPFRDASFDFILSLAMLEHVRYPLIVLREALRVLKPGGGMLGSVAFLVPFHGGGSYYDMTHLGIFNGLADAGFQVQRIAPDPRYSGLRALSHAGLFLGSPRRLAYALVQPLELLHRLWWRLLRLRDRSYTPESRLRHVAGAFIFVASRPETARDSAG